MTALSKPTKEDRPRRPMDTSELALPKENFDREARFRLFVSGHACLLSPWKNNECRGITEFAHITTGGRGIKGSDLHGVALCSGHHRTGPGSYHNLGSVEACDSTHGTDLWRENALLLAAWIRRISKEGSK
jgi:hypothetical protein